jgi:hypothetical protein
VLVPVPVRCSDVEWRIYGNFDGANWTDISRDVLESEGVSWDRGITGGGPNDRTASSGTLTFALNNSHKNSVGIVGFWSTSHVSARQGWDVGTPLRLDIAYQGRWVTQWIGRADEITPEHGILGSRRVYVAAKDWMEEAAEHKLKGLETLDNVTADEILTELLSVIPIQPPGGTVFDEGLDTYPLAFDDVRDGKTTAMTEFSKLANSGLDYIFVTKDGALRYQNRNTRLASTHNLFVLDGTMRDVNVSRARKDIVSRIEVTVHPRRVSTEYAVLWSLEDKPLIAPGETLNFRGEFIDPENPAERIGAVDVQTPLVAGQDFLASIQQAVASGTPDTPIVLYPAATGFYTTGAAGSVSSLGDGSDSTGMTPTGAGIKHSVTLTQITAASGAAVSGVRFNVRVDHSPQGVYGFFVLYPQVRLNGIDLDIKTAGGRNSVSSFTAGITQEFFEVPLPPGGGVWNVGTANEIEFVWSWNWAGDLSALPKLVHVDATLLYASAVEELDHTDDVTVVTTAGGNAADFAATNNGTVGVYLTRLQIRGRPVRKYDPVTSFVEDAASIAQYGEQLVTVDQSYQADVNKGVQAAEYLLYLYGQRADRAEQVAFLANLSEDHMNAALDREIGDRIGLAEEVTGLRAFTADGEPSGWYIQHVAGRITPGPIVDMTWTLAPADSQQYWHADIDGQNEAEETTVAGPM